MRFLTFVASFLFAALLSACGGGGGSPGLSTGSSSTFTVLAPSAVTLQVGSLQPYSIKGGVKPYAVYSSNPAVAVGWLSGDDVVYVGTVVAGSATVTVVDAKNTKFDMAVTSGSTTAFFTTAASSMTITPGVAYAQTYTLGGGTPPYTATSNFPSVATVAVNGNQMTITGMQISTTAATITVRDAAGATLTSAVTVGTVPLTVVPTAVTAFIGDKIRGVINGGTRPYTLVSAIDEFVLNLQIVEGNILEVVGGQVVENVSVVVKDANNQTAQLTLKLTAGQDVLRVQPSSMTIPESTSTPDITIMVYGASAAGGIQVFSTNTTLLAPQTPVKNVDNTGYAVKLTGGNTCSAAVTPGSAAIVGPPYVPAVPATGGDRTITITAMDAKGKVGTTTITIKDTNGQGGC